jgi:cation diffusion facilitator CzcD-associated flavoprotein CzcO
MTGHETSMRRDLRFVIIGAGMAGILSAIKLKDAGFDDVVIYEKADRIGGTWRENTYPGIACDVPSHFYSYSFALNPEWSRHYAPGPEIQAYFEMVARRFGVDSLIRYGKEIVRCEHEGGRWKLRSKDGTRDEADFVIAATGVLHHPAYPDIPGMDSFAGALFHSARWDHDVTISGKRVGVIGTGSSAVQIVSAVVAEVKALTLFQRTPQWITPIENTPFSEEEKARFREDSGAMMAIRAEVSALYIDGFSNHLSDMHSPQLQMIHEFCKAHLENSVSDPELREKLRPDYRAGCKRLILSTNFYEAIQRPNAKLVTEAIERIEPKGVRTRDSELHEVDVLVLATGFRVDRFLRPIEVIGRNGVGIESTWRDGPAAYLSLSVPDFPNLFLLNGPSAPVGNFSLIEVVELQFAYIMKLIEQVCSGRCRQISASHAALERFEADRKEAAKNTIWASGCKSWYLDADDLPTAWPWTYDRFREEMREPRLADYETR